MEAWTARETIGFMERAAAEGRPFIAWSSLPRPHSNYAPSEPFWSMYDERRLTLPPNVEYDMSLKAPHLRRMAERHTPGNGRSSSRAPFRPGVCANSTDTSAASRRSTTRWGRCWTG